MELCSGVCLMAMYMQMAMVETQCIASLQGLYGFSKKNLLPFNNPLNII